MIRFEVRNDKCEHGYPIRVHINITGKRINVGTGYYVSSPENFSEIKYISEEEPASKAKNLRLRNIISEIEMYSLSHKKPDDLKDFVIELLGGKRFKKHGKVFVNYLEEFISEKTKPGTINLYTTTKNKILAYDPNATFDTMTVEWLRKFEKYMSETMSINGYSIHLRNIRAVFNWAIDNEKTTSYPFRKFKIKKEETAKRSLTVEQLRQLMKYECEDFQTQYRDMFMLMFYLIGINAIDLFSLKAENLTSGGRIQYHRAKTNRLYDIKVEPEALELINKYKGKKYLLNPLDSYKDYKDYLHHMNDALKTVGKKYKLGVGWTGDSLFSDISSYWSRHTWATIAYQLDIPHDVIGQALGHAESDTTDIYIRYDNTKVDRANRKVIDYLKQ
jgi:integrase